jgi:hypothetical protein
MKFHVHWKGASGDEVDLGPLSLANAIAVGEDFAQHDALLYITDASGRRLTLAAAARLKAASPAPLTPAEALLIKQTVREYYGDDAIVRNYGLDPKRLQLHVETVNEPGMEQHECLGILMCEIIRDQISMEVTKRGTRIRGNTKLAYRQGEVI